MRGRESSVGDTRVAHNGYHYTKYATGWELTHRHVAEEMLGRPLEKNERIKFKNNDRLDLRPENLEVYITKSGSKSAKLARLISKRDDLQAQIDELEAELDS